MMLQSEFNLDIPSETYGFFLFQPCLQVDDVIVLSYLYAYTCFFSLYTQTIIFIGLKCGPPHIQPHPTRPPPPPAPEAPHPSCPQAARDPEWRAPRPPLVRRPVTRGARAPGRTHPPAPLVAPRTPHGTEMDGLVGALIGSLHPFLFPSLSLLSRAFALPRLWSPIPIRYCFLSFFVTLINYSFYMFRHVNIN